MTVIDVVRFLASLLKDHGLAYGRCLVVVTATASCPAARSSGDCHLSRHIGREARWRWSLARRLDLLVLVT